MLFLNYRISPKQRDIGWEHATSIGGDRKLVKYNYCRITIMKQHLAHVSGQVEACLKVPKEVSTLLRKHLSEGSKKNIHKSQERASHEIFN